MIKTCTIYATPNRHTAADTQSLTRELYKVTKQGTKSILIRDISKAVNDSWDDNSIVDQRCITEIVEMKDNWADYMWPTGYRKTPVDRTQDLKQPLFICGIAIVLIGVFKIVGHPA